MCLRLPARGSHLNEAVGVCSFLVVGDVLVAAKVGHGCFHERLHVTVNLRRKMGFAKKLVTRTAVGPHRGDDVIYEYRPGVLCMGRVVSCVAQLR